MTLVDRGPCHSYYEVVTLPAVVTEIICWGIRFSVRVNCFRGY